MSVYEPTTKRTSIGRGKVKTSTMNKHKEELEEVSWTRIMVTISPTQFAV